MKTLAITWQQQRFLLIWRSHRGIADLVLLAFALPLIILLITTAFDIMRIPIAKSQVYDALNSGYDYLLFNVGNDNLPARRFSGQNWCALVDDDPDAGENNCEPACSLSSPQDCTGAPPIGTWNNQMLSLAQSVILEQLEGSGLFGFGDVDPSLPATAGPTDMALKIGFYQLVVVGYSNTTTDSKVVINSEKIGEISWEGLNGYPTARVDLDQMVRDRYVSDNTKNILGFEYGTSDATHVGLIVLWAAVRVKHSLSFPQFLKLGLPQADGSWKTDESIVGAQIVRVVPRGIWPSK